MQLITMHGHRCNPDWSEKNLVPVTVRLEADIYHMRAWDVYTDENGNRKIPQGVKGEEGYRDAQLIYTNIIPEFNAKRYLRLDYEDPKVIADYKSAANYHLPILEHQLREAGDKPRVIVAHSSGAIILTAILKQAAAELTQDKRSSALLSKNTALVLIGGADATGPEPWTGVLDKKDKSRIFCVHNPADDVVPVANGDALRAKLRSSGFENYAFYDHEATGHGVGDFSKRVISTVVDGMLLMPYSSNSDFYKTVGNRVMGYGYGS
jgi:predicted esterase